MTANVQSYVLGDLLGAGGMGRVFATDSESNRPVVIKLLHESLQNEPFFVSRFLEEARSARAVRHPNVVRVIDDGLTTSGLPYLVMERVNGTPLGAMIRRDGPLSLQRVRTIAAQILAGVSAIHNAGLVHGDLKSDNVLVDHNDHATIIDFGLARPAGHEHMAEDGMISGTPEYMAPEVIGGGVLTPASEIYSVGVIVYEMLTGTTPFSGGSCSEVCMRHLTDEVVPPSLRAPDRAIPVPLETTVMRALAKAPDARHLTAALFGAAIECAIPAAYRETTTTPESRAFSTTAATRNWTRRREAVLPSALVIRRRDAVSDALALGNAEVVIVAYLALAQQLLYEHQIAEAIHELELGLAWLQSRSTLEPETWRLLLTLAAMCDGVGNRDKAASHARQARDIAAASKNVLGVARSNHLLRRLAAFARRSEGNV